MKGETIYNKIQANIELQNLELRGFIKGDKKGKTMDVPLVALKMNLAKQFRDWLNAYDSKNILDMKKALADLRNVAGCVFLKLLEGGDKKGGKKA